VNADGDRQTLTTSYLKTAGSQYFLRPETVERQQRVGGTWTTFAKSRQTWDSNNGAQVTDEVWVNANDADSAITRYDFDPSTGNRTKVWKAVQWAANPNPLTNLNRTTLSYDDRKLFVATEVNELGHQRDYVYEYGTGTKLETLGPNNPPCAALNPPSCPQGYAAKETNRIRVDGLGRMIEQFETYADPGANYLVLKVETNAYIDGPLASVTHQRAIDFNNNLVVRYAQDKTELDGRGRPIKTIDYVLGSAPADQITTFTYRHDGTLAEVV